MTVLQSSETGSSREQAKTREETHFPDQHTLTLEQGNKIAYADLDRIQLSAVGDKLVFCLGSTGKTLGLRICIGAEGRKLTE